MNEWILFPFPSVLYNWDNIFKLMCKKSVMTCPDIPWTGFKFLSMTHVNIRPVYVLWRKMVLEELRRRRHHSAQAAVSAHLTYGEWEKTAAEYRGGVAGESGMGGRGWLPAGLSPACWKCPSRSPRLTWPLKAPTTLASIP